MRLVTWLRSLAPRPASPRPRPAARPRAAFRPRLEALEDRQLLNASTAFDAAGNPLRLVVDNAGTLTETYLGQTNSNFATDVRRAHAYRDSDGSIGFTIIYNNGIAVDYDHSGGHLLTQPGQNIVDVGKAFDKAGHIQEDVTYQLGQNTFATFEYTSTAVYQVPQQQGLAAVLVHPFEDSQGNLGEDVSYVPVSGASTLIEYDSSGASSPGGLYVYVPNAQADRAFSADGRQVAWDVTYDTGVAVEYTNSPPPTVFNNVSIGL
jgi:hypothetical protein